MDFPGQDGLRRCRAELYGDRPCSPSTLTLQGKGQEELSISEARDTEEGDRHSGLPGSISPKLALMAPFQHLSRPAVQSQSPSLAKGTDPAATGVCCPVPHTWAVWGAEVQCPLPTQVPGLFGHSVALLQLPMQKDHSLKGEKLLPAQHQHQPG